MHSADADVMQYSVIYKASFRRGGEKTADLEPAKLSRT